jgi:hypothetical protein
MALTQRERTLIAYAGVALILLGGGFYLVLPKAQAIAAGIQHRDQLKTELAGLQAQRGSLQQAVQEYEARINMPKDIVIRSYEPEKLEKNLKEMLDQVLVMATESHNDLISLKPDATPSTTITPPTPAPASATPAAATASTPPTPATVDAQGQPVASAASVLGPPPNLAVYNYDLVVRGTYSGVLSFIAKLNHHRELIEVSNMTIENESGADRGATAGPSPETPGGANPLKPIRMTAKLKLYLIPNDDMLAVPTATPAGTAAATPNSMAAGPTPPAH